MISKLQEELSGYSNHKLYLKIKNTIVRDFLYNKDSDYLLDKYYDEASLRTPGLYQNALDDANIIIDSIRFDNLKSNINDYIRTDYFNNDDKDTIFEDEKDTVEKYNIEELTGVDFDNLIITKVSGDSMIDADIYDGDVIFADTKAEINNGDIIIASVNDAYYIKEYKITNNKTFLISKNPKYKPVEITEDMRFQIKGKVVNVMHRVNRNYS